MRSIDHESNSVCATHSSSCMQSLGVFPRPKRRRCLRLKDCIPKDSLVTPMDFRVDKLCRDTSPGLTSSVISVVCGVRIVSIKVAKRVVLGRCTSTKVNRFGTFWVQ